MENQFTKTTKSATARAVSREILERSTIETMANWQDNDKNQCNDDSQNNQFNLHILDPHLPSHLSSLLPEILRLHHNKYAKPWDQDIREGNSEVKERKMENIGYHCRIRSNYTSLIEYCYPKSCMEMFYQFLVRNKQVASMNAKSVCIPTRCKTNSQLQAELTCDRRFSVLSTSSSIFSPRSRTCRKDESPQL